MRSVFLVFAIGMSVVSVGYGQTPANPAGARPASGSTGASVTIEGCVVKEADVPSRRPPENVRAQAEAEEDYVLTSTKMISGNAPSGAAPSSGGDKATGTSGSSAALMYDIEGIEKDQLSAYLRTAASAGRPDRRNCQRLT